MKIMLVHTDGMINDTGGTAKVASLLANDMCRRGHEVTLIYSSEERGKFFFEIIPAIKTYNLMINMDGSKIQKPVYLKVWRELIRFIDKKKVQVINRDFNGKYLSSNLKYCLDTIKPDVIISFRLANSIMLINNLGTKIPVITMSHGQPQNEYDDKETEALQKSAAYQLLVPSFERHINKLLPKVKTITIGNAVPQFKFPSELTVDRDVHKIINVGRLCNNHKRQHLLIYAFEKIAKKYPNWVVEIWGWLESKAYYAKLQYFIKTHNLQDRVFFKGVTNDIGAVLKEGDIFAFPSHHEGFPLALAEGMSAGLPAVGYKNCAGVNEIIRNGKTGFLCDEGVDSFSLALCKLMEDKDLRVRMGRAAKEDMEQYAPERIFDKWENLVETVTNVQEEDIKNFRG